jgi:DNA-binding transcriptional LysR family regulator
MTAAASLQAWHALAHSEPTGTAEATCRLDLGRLNAPSFELAARVGLRAGRVRLAGCQTVLSTLVPKAATELSRTHPGIELNLVDAHPAEGLKMLRAGQITACERAGFSPRIAYSCDDTVVARSLVAAGMGVAILNGLASHAQRAPGIHTTPLTDNARAIYVATYGDPPDPPATTALIEILTSLPRHSEL